MIKVIVNPGVCGLTTEIKADSKDHQNSDVTIETACPFIKKIGEELKSVDGYKEIFAKYGDSTVYELAAKHCKHASCPVPSGILKAIEAACGLALPRDVEMKITKE
ncbi:hypothetical protein OXPF_16060 [Oxobacter pfennigii]|uniref:Uncharacterized protein n=1 Tax=Oxobacter pfennigii TaxID=36849 RepID=A0A0P8YBR0_9CLOT|nr:hypothetical protein [Oxobacter pfennigii]KPU44523.1 hypothetical protein OXPF_16060 [Oxobacter pfennigii]